MSAGTSFRPAIRTKRCASIPGCSDGSRKVSVWTYYIGVDDIDRAVAAINEGGGRILNGPMEIPGGEYALNAMDPQGAAFGLVGPRK